MHALRENPEPPCNHRPAEGTARRLIPGPVDAALAVTAEYLGTRGRLHFEDILLKQTKYK